MLLTRQLQPQTVAWADFAVEAAHENEPRLASLVVTVGR